MSEQEAGRALDAEVAAKVMGFGDRVVYRPSQRGEIPWCVIDGAFPCAVSHYSTDIAAAWQVVDKIPFMLRLEDLWGAPAGDRWRAEFLDNETVVGMAEEATPELAICKAALATLEG